MHLQGHTRHILGMLEDIGGGCADNKTNSKYAMIQLIDQNL